MDTIHQVLLTNTPSFSNLNLFFDILKPLEAKRCYICVTKFNSSYPISFASSSLINFNCEEITILCDSVENSYCYNSSSNMVLRSNVIDTFLTSNISLVNNEHIAFFNTINTLENWYEISINRLPHISFTFLSNYDSVNANNYAVPFIYNLHLKVKFSV